MPKINSYENDGSLSGADKLLGSNAANGVTQNYRLSDLAAFINAQAGAAGLTEEEVQDIVGAMVSENTETNISVTYDDTNGKLNFVSTDTNTDTQLTEEQVQDFVGNMLTGNQTTNITVTYDDVNNKINFVSTNTQLSQSEVESYAGGLFTNNPETNITSTFDSGTGKVTLNAVGKEKTVVFGSADYTLTGTDTVISFAQIGTSPFPNRTKQYNQNALVLDASNGTIKNNSNSSVDIILKVSALLTTPSGASTVTYKIETAEEGDGSPGDWSVLSHLSNGIKRKRNDAGTHIDGFSLAIGLPANNYVRLLVSGDASNMILLNESIYEFSIL